MSFLFECPSCEAVLRADEETVGQLGECLQCHEVVRVPPPLPGQKDTRDRVEKPSKER